MTFPAADTHVHLLAGLDDGPRTADEAVSMCRALVADGARSATALAHQNPQYPGNTPAALTAAAAELRARLAEHNVPLAVYPTGEVMVSAETANEFRAGMVQTVGGHGKHLLIEMPHALFLDVRPLAHELRAAGVRLVIAHAERYAELLHDPGLTDAFLRAGCLIQVTAHALAAPDTAADERALKDWCTRGVVHVLGTDGHNLDRRPPRLRAGVRRLAKWAGPAAADRVASIWGTALLQGGPLNPPPPRPKPRTWFARLLGG